MHLIRHGESLWNGGRRIQGNDVTRRVVLVNDTRHLAEAGRTSHRETS